MDDFFKKEKIIKYKISTDEISKVKKNWLKLFNFYFFHFLTFTLVYIDKFKGEEKSFKPEIIKDSQEYFSSTHCFIII